MKMIGKNKLEINQVELYRAISKYLNETILGATLEVVSIKVSRPKLNSNTGKKEIKTSIEFAPKKDAL
jgi:hypothetical protein